MCNPEVCTYLYLATDGKFTKIGISKNPGKRQYFLDSPRQISECYKSIGLKVGMEETQNARLYKRVRDAMDQIILSDGIVLSFGWNSAGMGVKRGYEMIELLLVAHGGGHNDTICVAERKLQRLI